MAPRNAAACGLVSEPLSERGNAGGGKKPQVEGMAQGSRLTGVTDGLSPRKRAGMPDVITCTSEGDDPSGRRRRGVNRHDDVPAVRRKGASPVPGYARPARWPAPGNLRARRMIPLESPVPEIGRPGSARGRRKRAHGCRTAARRESAGRATDPTDPYRLRASPRLDTNGVGTLVRQRHRHATPSSSRTSPPPPGSSRPRAEPWSSSCDAGRGAHLARGDRDRRRVVAVLRGIPRHRHRNRHGRPRHLTPAPPPQCAAPSGAPP